MGRKVTAFEGELYQRTDEVMHFVWDPIGVAGIPQARDEYDSYLPTVFSMLMEKKSEEEVARYLTKIEQDRMGLTPNHERATSVASILVDWLDTLTERYKHSD